MADAVVVQTEGWPVGIYLAAGIARDAGSASSLTGSDRYVADYLYRETMGRQSEHVKRFLRRTAVLDDMSGPLCDAVVGTSGGAQQLHDLEVAGLFAIPLDRQRQWYRYHGLFREFLLDELQRNEPAMREDLHRRAAEWFEANRSAARAMEHLLLTSEHMRAAQLISRTYTGDCRAWG
jgi:LuxR family maltose regulon positive regulatory protein